MSKNIFIVAIVIIFIGVGSFLWSQEVKRDQNLLDPSPTIQTDTVDTSAGSHDESNGNSYAENNFPAGVEDIVDLTVSENVTVRIQNYEYIPRNIKIKTGTTITWVNEDDMKHNVMLDHEDSETPHDAALGQDPTKFESPLLTTGEMYSFTFNQATDNPYHCSPHPWMKGKIEVVN